MKIWDRMKKQAEILKNNICRQNWIILLVQACSWKDIRVFWKPHEEHITNTAGIIHWEKKKLKPCSLLVCFVQVTMMCFVVPKIWEVLITPFTKLKMAMYTTKAFTYSCYWHWAAVDSLNLMLSYWLQTTNLHPSKRSALLFLFLQHFSMKSSPD